MPPHPYSHKIFEIGHGRTGTTSLWRACEHLGYRGVHGLHGTRHKQEVLAKMLAGHADWRFVEDYDFVGNFPFPFYRELDRLHPHAKFILTVRDEQAWLASIERQFQRTRGPRRRADRRKLTIGVALRLTAYGCVVYNRERFLAAYREHNRQVTEYFLHRYGIGERDSKLLVLNVCDFSGESCWRRLCEFLGHPVPDDIPFPHEHSA